MQVRAINLADISFSFVQGGVNDKLADDATRPGRAGSSFKMAEWSPVLSR
jgi:hypothetical protein